MKHKRVNPVGWVTGWSPPQDADLVRRDGTVKYFEDAPVVPESESRLPVLQVLTRLRPTHGASADDLHRASEAAIANIGEMPLSTELEKHAHLNALLNERNRILKG